MTHDENAREDFQKVKSLERQVESLKKRVAELEQDAIDKCLTTTRTDEVVELLRDYGIKDISILKYILDQYQKVIVNITNGRMSYLTYPAETILSVASDIYNEDLEKAINDAVTDRVAYIKGYSKGYDDGRMLRDKVAEIVCEVMEEKDG